MEGELATDQIKAQGRKGEHGGVGLHPGDVRSLGTGLPQHAERPVDPDQPGAGRGRAVDDKLIAGAAGDVERGRRLRGGALRDERQEFRIGRSRPVGLRVIEGSDGVVVCAGGEVGQQVSPGK
ncbi:MAG TPA: hypothetical protein VJ770_06850 [Stellaceae bacterium]|nr:hypothetical protein [Stellaceae bacterium]